MAPVRSSNVVAVFLLDYCQRFLRVFLALLGVLLFIPQIVFAQVAPEASFWMRETITGDWGGRRSKLSDKGIDFQFVYTGEVFANVSGGVQRQADYLDNLDLILEIDAEKLWGWKGASFHLYGLANQGGSPSANSGDAQGVSNIESPDAWKLYEAWFQQKLFNDKLSILLGLYDYNSEFDGLETACLFINPSHGIGPDIAQSGVNGPSIFPTASLGARVYYEPKPWLYFQTVVLDGVPGDPAHTHSTRIKLSSGDGLLLGAELGFLPGAIKEDAPYGKFAIGGWYYTSRFDDLSDVDGLGNPVRRRSNFGIYALGEYAVYREANDHEQGLSIFGDVGYANANINPLNFYVGAGAVYTGLFPNRNKDKLGIAVATAINGKKIINKQSAAGTPVKKVESNIEISYRAQITPWLAVQPDVQLIINPGMDPSRSQALQTGLRFEAIF